MQKNDDRGFSLVELIIVIAIMAILIGVLAPQYLRYVKKANVASDKELLAAVYEAVIYTSMDPDIVKDSTNQAIVDSMVNNVVCLEDLDNPAGNDFAKEVMSSLKWDDLDQSTYERLIRSPHDSSCHIYMTYQGGLKNPLIMWISTTDKTGGSDTTNTSTDPDNIGNCIVIR